MSQCGDFDYQLVEFGALHDLKAGQLYRAQIDSINRNANTAGVTLLDVCPTVGTADLAAVPFFYHCEFSTGTVEDLAHGHSAFAVADIVYLLFVPAFGRTAQRLYVIGHVDIRGTMLCSATDYVLIEAGKNGTSSIYVTLFNVATRKVVDPATFKTLVGSPTRPDQFPCLLTSAVSDWISYNFITAEWGANVELLIKRQLYAQGSSVTTVLSEDSNAGDADPHTYSKVWTREFDGDQGFMGEYSVNYENSDLLEGTINLGQVYTFYRHSQFYSEFDGVATQEAGSSGWNMYDANSATNALMPVLSRYEVSAVNNSYGGPITSDWFESGPYISHSETTVSVEFTASIKYPYSDDAFEVLTIDSDYSGACARIISPWTYECTNVSGNIIHGPMTGTDYRALIDTAAASGSYPLVEIINNGATLLAPNTLIFATAVGAFGVYSVLYFRTMYRETTAEDNQLVETVGAGGMYYHSHGVKTVGYTQVQKDSTFAIATMFEDVPTFVPDEDLPVEDCLRHINQSVSAALGAASEELEQLINDTTSGYKHDHYYVKVYNKKKVA